MHVVRAGRVRGNGILRKAQKSVDGTTIFKPGSSGRNRHPRLDRCLERRKHGGRASHVAFHARLERAIADIDREARKSVNWGNVYMKAPPQSVRESAPLKI